MELVKTVVNSAMAVATTKAARMRNTVELSAPGTAFQRVARPATNRIEKAAIQGFRRPPPSATAPRNGLPNAMSTPAVAAA